MLYVKCPVKTESPKQQRPCHATNATGANSKGISMTIVRCHRCSAASFKKRISLGEAAKLLDIRPLDLTQKARKGLIAFDYLADTLWFDPAEIRRLAGMRGKL